MREPNKNYSVLCVAISSLATDDGIRLGKALIEIARLDATIIVYSEPTEGQFVVAGTSQSHLEAICEQLRYGHKLMINIGEPKVAFRETIRRGSEAEGKYIRQTGGSGNYGHCKIRLAPSKRGNGYEFINDVKGGAIPKEFIKPIEQGIRDALDGGILAGYPVIDVTVTLYDGSYHDVDSNEVAYRIAGSIAFKEAAKKASPVLLEPVIAVEVKVREDLTGAIIGEINSRRGRVEGIENIGDWQVIKALVPMSELLGSSSRRIFEHPMKFAGYEPMPNGGWLGGTEPAVPAVLPKVPRRGLGSAAVSLDSELD